MDNWTPVFSEISDSSLNQLPLHVRWAFVIMASFKDHKTQLVRINAFRLARKANITNEQAEEALRILSSPDGDTLSQQFEGRRILKQDDETWLIVNGAKYQGRMKAEISREMDAKRQREWRERNTNKECVDSTRESKPAKPPPAPDIPESLRTPEFEAVWKDWMTHLAEKRKKPTKLAISRQLSKCEQMGQSAAIAMINHSIQNNWQGLFEPNGQTVKKRKKAQAP